MTKVFSLWKGEMLVSGPTGTMADILADVAERHGVKVSDLKSPLRYRKLAWPRQEAMWLMTRVVRADGRARYSLPQIGTFLGGRDHSTIIHGSRAHAERNGLEYPVRFSGLKRQWREAA